MTGAVFAIEGACLTLGRFSLRAIDLELDAGEIMVLLGPNGAGKSVCLEMIAGFHRPTSGRILIHDRDVTSLPPERRRVGLVFQNFGLFPHFTVAGNVSLGLHARRRVARAQATRGVGELLAQFGIAHLSDRYPQDLSPGEKQRVALARGLAAQPDLFLFDEPFSALDARTRDALRDELKTFLRQSGAPAIFVSHDQTDAALLADRVAVMNRGEILQIGAVSDIFGKPVNAFVAEFTGVHAGYNCQQLAHDYEQAFAAARKCAADYDWDAAFARRDAILRGPHQAAQPASTPAPPATSDK